MEGEGRDGTGALPARDEAGDEGVIRAVEVRMLPALAIEAPPSTLRMRRVNDVVKDYDAVLPLRLSPAAQVQLGTIFESWLR